MLHGGFLNDIKVIMYTVDGGYKLVEWLMGCFVGGLETFAKHSLEIQN